MPFCPRCRYEYEAGALVCPDCSEALLSHLPLRKTVAMQPDDSWVVIGRVPSGVSAEMAKGSLDSNNIPSVLLSPSLTHFAGGLNVNTSLERTSAERNVIMVPREYREEAEIVLEAVLGDELIQPDI
ncbi:MAG: hypothetical protein KAT79_06275 [candidate division Zixibacteria bacterium]|nr:hypothetical protein [candidate division Zixibacteria bacterium]